MCRRVDCRTCGRPTYAGCGAHIEKVLGDVPPAERCQCRETAAKDAPKAAPGARRSWLSAIFGK